MSRPEGKSAPDVYYDETEAKKYDSSSRMRTIQVFFLNPMTVRSNFSFCRPKSLLVVLRC
jgi:hypothetical protein